MTKYGDKLLEDIENDFGISGEGNGKLNIKIFKNIFYCKESYLFVSDWFYCHVLTLDYKLKFLTL